MKRKCLKVDANNHETVIIMVDLENAEDILPYVFGAESVLNEFKDIRGLLKENLRNKQKYCKVDVSDKADNMYEMRFTNSGRNDRIYCQEFRRGNARVIVMIELFQGKKSQDIPKKIKSRIETMGGYIYG